MINISPLADVHPDAVIGDNVEIESFAKVGRDVVIGNDTWIGSNACIYNGARIGSHCRIFPGAVISAVPQDLKFKGDESFVHIGNHATIREYATVHRGTFEGGITSVGDHTLVMAYAHVGHDTRIGDHCVIVNSVQLAGEVTVGDWAVIGGMSAVHQFCRIGAHAMVSGMSGVLSDVAPFTKVFGVPAKYVGVNSIGLRRRGFSNERITAIHDVYRALYYGKMNTSQALDYISEHLDTTSDTAQILDFMSGSQRGIIKSLGGNGEAPQEKVSRVVAG